MNPHCTDFKSVASANWAIGAYVIKVKPYLSFDTLVRHQKAKAVTNHNIEIIIIYMSFSLSRSMVIKVKVVNGTS